MNVFRKVPLLFGTASLLLLLSACGGGSSGGGGGGAGDSITSTGQLQPLGETSQPLAETSDPPAETSDPPAETNQRLSSASLSWNAPIQRTDGEPLSMNEIDGYRIYYGTRSGDYDYRIEIADAFTTSYVIDDLPLGTYYIVLTAFDLDGRESGYSNEAVKAVN